MAPSDILASTEARTRLPQLIETLVEHPEEAVVVGRQRRREVVMMSAARFDALVQREDDVRDISWALFAQERIAHPSGDPISLEDGRRLRDSHRR